MARLKECVYLRLDGGTLFGTAISPALGHTLALVDPEYAGFFKAQAEKIGTAHEVLVVGDPWDLARQVAPLGYPGLRVVSPPALTVRFDARLDEVTRDSPTVLTLIGDWSRGPLGSRGRAGTRIAPEDPIVAWQRFDLLDRLDLSPSEQWHSPFPDWHDGAELWELVTENGGATLAAAAPDVLGPWNTGVGSPLYFSSRERAERFVALRGHSPPLDLGLQAFEPVDLEGEEHELAAWAVVPRQIVNAATELARRRRPAGHYVLNLESGRSLMGVGDVRLPTVFRTTSGWWRFEQDGTVQAVLVTEHGFFSGWDTFYWPGDHTYDMEYPAHSFQSPSGDRWSSAEAQEGVRGALTAEHSPPGDLWDAYVVVTRDAVWEDRSFRFYATPEAAWSWLAQYATATDEPLRTRGLTVPQLLGIPGSGNAESERLSSIGLERALARVTMDYLTQGYKPAQTRAVEGAANLTLGSIAIEGMGYLRDLLWSSAKSDEYSDDATLMEFERPLLTELLQSLGECRHIAEAWLVSVGELPVDAEGEREAASLIGRETWELLTPRSRHFIATGLYIRKSNRRSPQFDYSPVVSQMSKAVEVELVELAASFRDSGVPIEELDAPSREEQLLARFARNETKLTLGNFPFLLRAKDGGEEGTLWSEWASYLKDHPAAEHILSKGFRRSISRLVEKFRNRGAHEASLSAGDCDQVVRLVLEGRSSILSHLASGRDPHGPIDVPLRPSTTLQRAVDHYYAHIRVDDAIPSPPIGPSAPNLGSHKTFEDGIVVCEVRDDFAVMFQPQAAVRIFHFNPDAGAVLQWGITRNRLRRLARALTRRRVNWQDTPELEVISGPDAGTLVLRFAQPGVRARVALDEAQSAALSSFLRRANEGEFGPVGDRFMTSNVDFAEWFRSFLESAQGAVGGA